MDEQVVPSLGTLRPAVETGPYQVGKVASQLYSKQQKSISNVRPSLELGKSAASSTLPSHIGNGVLGSSFVVPHTSACLLSDNSTAVTTLSTIATSRTMDSSDVLKGVKLSVNDFNAPSMLSLAASAASPPDFAWTQSGPCTSQSQRYPKGHLSRGIKASNTTPAAEYVGKLRWQTPLRAGNWQECWQSARELGMHLSVLGPKASFISAVLRRILADAVVTYVGPHLPRATVDKWLCLLCEYLELDTDEQILVICLLRRYAFSGGRFVGCNDWARPQRWECVIAIACYLSVLLTEEFPGRTALDLKELLGVNFKFGLEQVSFLETIDWRICISSDEISDAKGLCERIMCGKASETKDIRKWFGPEARDVADGKRRFSASFNHQLEVKSGGKLDALDTSAMNTSNMLRCDKPFMSVLTKDGDCAPVCRSDSAYYESKGTTGKKRSFSSLARTDDSVVPPLVVRRVDPTEAAPTVYTQHIQMVTNIDGVPPAGACMSTIPSQTLGGFGDLSMTGIDTIPSSVSSAHALSYWAPHW